MWGRRKFLNAVALGLGGAVLSRGARAAPRVAKSELAAQSLGTGLFLITGAGGNVVAWTGSQGAVLIDAGLAEHSAALLQIVRARTGARRVNTVFNTHWHWDHTGGNETLRRAGARILAHANTRLWLSTPVFLEWEPRRYPARPAAALPDQTFYGDGTLEFDERELRHGYAPQAHTDGDIHVFLPDANVLACGDLAASGSYPVLDYCTGGWIGGMLDASAALLKLCDAGTRIVPGRGSLLTRADLSAQHEMLGTVKQRLVDLIRKGMSASDMIAARPTREFDAQWGDPRQFIANAYRGMFGHVRELGGII